MDALRLAFLPVTATVGTVRALTGLGEVIAAARPLAAEDGPLRRPDGVGPRLTALLAPGGGLDQLGRLSELSVTLERLAGLDESLRRLGALEESLAALGDLGESLQTLAALGDSLQTLATLGDSLRSIADAAASLEQLATHARALPELAAAVETLPELPARVQSVEEQVVAIGAVLSRLQPGIDGLGTSVETLSRSLVPLGKVAERLPGRRRPAVA